MEWLKTLSLLCPQIQSLYVLNFIQPNLQDMPKIHPG